MKSLFTMAISLAFFSSAAFAGFSQPAPVEVDLDLRSATGDMLTAATDRAANVLIGCGTRNYDDGVGGVFTFGFCQAEDAEGDNVVCGTFNPELVQAIRAISDFSFIAFNWDEELNCTSIGISTQSVYIDKPK